MNAKYLISIFLLLLFQECNFEKYQKEAFQKMKEVKVVMNDQSFKTSIALIELHKTRFGTYPDSLGQLRYIGHMFDSTAILSVSYHKLDDGYELSLSDTTEHLKYPKEFWQGLGIKKSNLNNFNTSK